MSMTVTQIKTVPGRFGAYGGRYVPETLTTALEELEREYEKARRDKKFTAEFGRLLKEYAGRPTPLFFAERHRRASLSHHGARFSFHYWARDPAANSEIRTQAANHDYCLYRWWLQFHWNISSVYW